MSELALFDDDSEDETPCDGCGSVEGYCSCPGPAPAQADRARFEGRSIGTYRTIYADPPWPERGAGQCKRGADRHYPTMKIKDIAALPVRDLVSPAGCHLWMWATGNYLEAAFLVMASWGFKYLNFRPWVKMDQSGEGIWRRQNAGLGQYLACDSEILLFGRSGKPMPYKLDPDGRRTKPRQSLLAPKTGKHSEKPPEARRDIERVSYPPYIELFCRERATGWDAWGNETETDVRLVGPVSAAPQLALI